MRYQRLWNWACVLAVLIAAVPGGWAAAQAVRLPAILSDHMVLQRDVSVPVWGWAKPGDEVTVRFKGQTKTTRVGEDQRWEIKLDAMAADAKPATLSVTSSGQTVTVEDVLVGEVWLCSGQSNMEWDVRRSANAEQEIADANWPQIRHIKAPHSPQMLPQSDIKTSWTVCSPQTVAQYTAVGYYFGRRLHQELGVPVGLVNCSWGGTRIEPWTPIEGFAAVPETKHIYEQTQARIPGSDAYAQQVRAFIEAMNAWEQQAKQQLAQGQPVTPPNAAYPQDIQPYTSHQDPTMLYNGMVAPFVPFAIRGSIWYQGESNRGEGMAYVDKTRALVEGWRKKWGIPDLPYYFVQIAPFQYSNEDPTILPTFWEAQAAITEKIHHTGMVVISDVGNLGNIHPTNKQDVGLRLANMALKRDYGRNELIDSSPRFKAMSIDGGTVRITFEDVGEGLASRDGKPLTHFELAGNGQPWATADVKVVGRDTLELSAKDVASPTAVRFAWHKLATPNLMNSAGLPAVPFRAGDEPDLSSLGRNVPEAKDYELVYALDLKNLRREIQYDIDRHSQIAGPFDRVAYYVELGDDSGNTQWVFVAMDAFTDDLGKIAVPTFASGARFQQAVANLSVRSNVQGLPNGDELRGNIEFWPNNYAKDNSANISGAAANAYDTGDTPVEPANGYGSMQVHLAGSGQTLFAINHWLEGNNADLGIGTNRAGGEPDWTFTKSASRYTVKELRVLVRLKH